MSSLHFSLERKKQKRKKLKHIFFLTYIFFLKNIFEKHIIFQFKNNKLKNPKIILLKTTQIPASSPAIKNQQ